MSAVRDKKILLVEDEYLIAMMAEEMLKTLGAQVVGPAAAVDKALALIESNEVDCAVLDVNLKNETSDAIAEKLKQLDIPYIYATGHGHQDLDAILLAKPYTEANLFRALEQALSRGRLSKDS